MAGGLHDDGGCSAFPRRSRGPSLFLLRGQLHELLSGPTSMSEIRSSRFHLPVAVSTFAGFLGAGVFDAFLVLVRGHQARLFEALALSVGLYGSAGLLCA